MLNTVSPRQTYTPEVCQIGNKTHNQLIDIIEIIVIDALSSTHYLHNSVKNSDKKLNQDAQRIYQAHHFTKLTEAQAFAERQGGTIELQNGKSLFILKPHFHLQQVLNKNFNGKPLAEKDLLAFTDKILKCSDADLLRAAGGYSKTYHAAQAKNLAHYTSRYADMAIGMLESQAPTSSQETSKDIESKSTKCLIDIYFTVQSIKTTLAQLQQFLPKELQTPPVSYRTPRDSTSVNCCNELIELYTQIRSDTETPTPIVTSRPRSEGRRHSIVMQPPETIVRSSAAISTRARSYSEGGIIPQLNLQEKKHETLSQPEREMMNLYKGEYIKLLTKTHTLFLEWNKLIVQEQNLQAKLHESAPLMGIPLSFTLAHTEKPNGYLAAQCEIISKIFEAFGNQLKQLQLMPHLQEMITTPR